jgi:hypothetical protein
VRIVKEVRVVEEVRDVEKAGMKKKEKRMQEVVGLKG